MTPWSPWDQEAAALGASSVPKSRGSAETGAPTHPCRPVEWGLCGQCGR